MAGMHTTAVLACLICEIHCFRAHIGAPRQSNHPDEHSSRSSEPLVSHASNSLVEAKLQTKSGRIAPLKVLALLLLALDPAVAFRITSSPGVRRTALTPAQPPRSLTVAPFLRLNGAVGDVNFGGELRPYEEETLQDEVYSNVVQAEVARAQINEFKDLWESGQCDEAAVEKLRAILSRGHIYGRLLHAKPDDFGYLHPSTWKRFTFVFGRRALEAFLGKDARGIAQHLQLTRSSIDSQLDRGHTYKLALFTATPNFDCVLGTWDGLEYMIRRHYPEVADKVCASLPEIRSLTFKEIQDMAGYDMLFVHAKRALWGRDVSDFDGTVVGVRQWLMDHIGLNDDYTGTGYTKGEDGTREYFAENRQLDQLPGSVFIDLHM